MDIELLTADAKWQLLDMLSKKEQSPTELAQRLGTSVANISMQLRLLQAAGIVRKQRTSESKAGKPRLLYSLTKDIFALHVASKNIQIRKLFTADQDKLALASIWQLPANIQFPLSQLYFTQPQLFDKSDVYYVDHSEQTINIAVVSTTSAAPKTIVQQTRDTKYTIHIQFKQPKDFDQKLLLIHKGT